MLQKREQPEPKPKASPAAQRGIVARAVRLFLKVEPSRPVSFGQFNHGVTKTADRYCPQVSAHQVSAADRKFYSGDCKRDRAPLCLAMRRFSSASGKSG